MASMVFRWVYHTGRITNSRPKSEEDLSPLKTIIPDFTINFIAGIV